MIKRRFTLKDIEKITGIRANRLRIWKKRYGILDPQRTEGKTHYYSSETLRYMMKVAKLLDQDYRISQILEMDQQKLDDRLTSIIQQQSDVFQSQLRDKMLEAVLELEHRKLQHYYGNALERIGFKPTIKKLLLPLLRTVGELWEIGTVHSVHEHLLSNFIRQKLMVAVDHLEPDENQPESALYLPDQELHDIPLLFIQYNLLNDRQNPVFLGASVPYPDLKDYLEVRQPARAIGYLTFTGNLEFHIEQMPELLQKYPDIAFHFGIPPASYEDLKEGIQADEFRNLHLYKDRDQFIEGIIEAANDNS